MVSFVLTVPFGQAKILRPYHKIYDFALIKQSLQGLEITEEEYYMWDSNHNWYKCSRSQAEAVDATIHDSAICLLKIVKNER